MDGFKNFLAKLPGGLIFLLFFVSPPLAIAAIIGKNICQDMLEDEKKQAELKKRQEEEARRKAREAARDVQEKNRRYYAAHAEQERSRARARYWRDRAGSLADLAYQRRKRKMMEVVV